MTSSEDDGGKQILHATLIAAPVFLFLIIVNYALASANTIEYLKPEPQIVERTVLIEVVNTKEPEPVVVPSDTFLYYASYCESRHRQFDENGDILLGRVDPRDTGRWQINTYYWGEKAIELGYDIYTEQGNYDMAKYILEEAQGESAWSASAPCIAKNFGYTLSS